jgi:sec-independent protein translocase protein TatC
VTGELPAVKHTPTEEELIAGGKVMSLFDHLAELRNRIVKSLAGVIVVFGVAFGFADKLIIFLKQPLMDVLPPGMDALHFTGPMDVFVINIKVAALVALVGGSPIWLYQFWKFFEPALYPRERKYILPFVFASVLFFLLGTAFCYFAILPLTLDFLIKLGMEVGQPMITIKDYVSLLLLLIAGFGIVFETPVLIVLLAMLDIVTVETLTKYRRLVVVLILIVAAVLTPPDPISQVALAVPVYIMYELAIIVIRVIKKRQAPT